MSRKLYIKTYGCQMNVYDSNRMADMLAPMGFETVDAPDAADLVILNTCHIREKAAEKVYSDVGRLRLLKQQKKAGGGGEMLLAVGGCVGQAEGAEIMRRAPAVDIVFGPQTYHRLPDLVNEAARQRAEGRPPRVLDTDFPTEAKFDALPKAVTSEGLSAFLTVQEGCDKFCAFCVVPYTRGSEYSRPVVDVEDEARRLVAGGAMEITLLGQNVNAYHGAYHGANHGAAQGPNEPEATMGLGPLIGRLAEIDGLERIRYTTSHPRDMNDELIRAHAEVPECMPYIHLPVQSGSDRILKAMNRQHKADEYRDIIERLRAARPDIAVSGDFIVGFPGETDADFEDTMQLVRDIGYAQAYSFKYSPRPGTPASTIETQVPEEVKSERLQALQNELNTQQRTFNEATVGQRFSVLMERSGRNSGQIAGRSPYMQAVHVDIPPEPSAQRKLDGVVDGAYTSQVCSHTEGQIDGNFRGVAQVEIVAAGPNSLQGRLE